MKILNDIELENFILVSLFFIKVGSPQIKLEKFNNKIETQIGIDIYFDENSNQHYMQKKNYQDFFQNYQSINSVILESSLSNQTIRKIIKQHDIPLISFGRTYDQMFIRKDSIKKYIFNDKYISIYQLVKKMGIHKESSDSRARSSCRAVLKTIEKHTDSQEVIGYKQLDFPLFFKDESLSQYKVFDKQKVKSFFENHVPVSKYLDETKTQRSNFLTLINNKNISIYYFYSNHKYNFISLKDYTLLKEHHQAKKSLGFSGILTSEKYNTYQSQKSLITKNKLPRLLTLTEEALEKFLFEYKILPDETINTDKRIIRFYEMQKIEILINKQKELFTKYSRNYKTIAQLLNDEVSDKTAFLIYNGVNSNHIKRIVCPTILRGLFKLTSSTYLYNTVDVTNYISRYNEKLALNSTNLEHAFPDYLYKTEDLLNVEFPPFLSNTKDLWYQFVKSELKKMNEEDFNPYTTLFSKITRKLTQLLEKEIYKYSPVSLNNLIFNPKSLFPRKHQILIYKFLQSIRKSFLQNNISDNYFDLLTNPSNHKSLKTIDTGRYSYEEYLEIYKYASDVSYHKNIAITEVKKFLDGEKYTHYDSYWLYILIHLTNSWRHSTIVTEIPEITLPQHYIGTLEWIETHDVTTEEADSIIYQLGRTLININKTGAETEFRIADPVKVPFATAIIICQIRKNLYSKVTTPHHKAYGPLIWLPYNRIIAKHHTPHKLFFQNFRADFTFKNRKMNKTLMTLIWSVTRSLDATQLSRSHFSPNSTMTYIKLSDQQVENLVHQLFERNTFGYLAKLLADKVFDNKDVSESTETLRIKSIADKFGSIHKLEITIGILNQIAQNEHEVRDYLKGLSQEEAKRIYLSSLSNTLFSKKEFYQCALSFCKYDDDRYTNKDCSNCHFAIVNLYAISNLMELYLTKIDELIMNFEKSSIGEKKKMANQFFLIWRQVSEAKERFGDEIYSFVEGGKERFNLLSSQLPESKKYITFESID